jgi:hypothetical protein
MSEIQTSRISALTLNFLRLLRVLTLFHEVESHVTLALNYQVKIKYDGMNGREISFAIINSIQALRNVIGNVASELSLSTLNRYNFVDPIQPSSSPELNFISSLLIEMEAIFLTSDVLGDCEVSPLTCQKFLKRLAQNKKRQVDGDKSSSLEDDSQLEGDHGSIQSFESESECSLDTSGGDDVPMLYANEISNGRKPNCRLAALMISYSLQILKLLSRPNILRSKLCFAFFKYIQVLNNRMHLWQVGSLSSIHTEFAILNMLTWVFPCVDRSLSLSILLESAFEVFP